MMSQQAALPKRRNGKSQACEPCRKRKSACDHTLPVCMRCRHRKTTAGCVYLPAPMTRNVRPVQTDSSDLSFTLPILNTPSQGLLKGRRKVEKSVKASAGASSIFHHCTEFLGPTSFSAVFTENLSKLEPKQNLHVSVASDRSESLTSLSDQRDQDESFNHDVLLLGVKILSQIPDETTCKTLFQRNVLPGNAWVTPAAKYTMQRLFDTFGKDLAMSSGTGLHELARLICANTATAPEGDDDDDPIRWMDSFSGRRLRWEALGMLFTYWAFGAMSTPENEAISSASEGNSTDARQLMLDMKHCAWACASMCNYIDSVNVAVVSLLYRHTLLESIVSGDASLTLWRLHADTAAVAICLGLHRDSEAPRKVTVKSEIRRRLYASIFTIDKTLAALLGRPPSLSRRYTSALLPLDISDEVLISDETTRSKAVASLDANGWNTEGQIHFTTIARARMLHAYIRDEVLEISLGAAVDDAENRVKELKQRSNLTYAGLPDSLKLREEDISDPTMPNQTMYTRLLTRMDNLQILFLLERLLIKYGRADGQELLDTAGELLRLKLVFWKQRGRFLELQGINEFIIMYYAVPASGVLCVFLMQTKDRPHERLTLPRSQTIRNLSSFVEYLEWIKPSAPNADLCHRVRDIISRVLDQVLEFPATTAQANALESEQIAFDDLNLPSDFYDFENFANFYLPETFDVAKSHETTHPCL